MTVLMIDSFYYKGVDKSRRLYFQSGSYRVLPVLHGNTMKAMKSIEIVE